MNTHESPLVTIIHIAKCLERELSQSIDESESQISHADAKLLVMVHCYQGASQSDLANLLQISPPAVSRQITRIENQGYITRNSDPENRRSVQVLLTKEGLTKAKELKSHLEKQLQTMSATLPTINKDTHALLQKIASQVEQNCI